MDVKSMFGKDKTPPEDVKALQAEIERLTAALAVEVEARTAAEEEAKTAVSAQAGFAIMQRGIEEQPTGKTVTMPSCVKYDVRGHTDDGRALLKPVFEDVEVPTFFYKIDLPPSGGTEVKVGGEHFQHGETYTLDLHLLRTVKDMVWRAWAHDATIHGNDENVFRKPTNQALRGRGARA